MNSCIPGQSENSRINYFQPIREFEIKFSYWTSVEKVILESERIRKFKTNFEILCLQPIVLCEEGYFALDKQKTRKYFENTVHCIRKYLTYRTSVEKGILESQPIRKFENSFNFNQSQNSKIL